MNIKTLTRTKLLDIGIQLALDWQMHRDCPPADGGAQEEHALHDRMIALMVMEKLWRLSNPTEETIFQHNEGPTENTSGS